MARGCTGRSGRRATSHGPGGQRSELAVSGDGRDERLTKDLYEQDPCVDHRGRDRREHPADRPVEPAAHSGDETHASDDERKRAENKRELAAEERARWNRAPLDAASIEPGDPTPKSESLGQQLDADGYMALGGEEANDRGEHYAPQQEDEARAPPVPESRGCARR